MVCRTEASSKLAVISGLCLDHAGWRHVKGLWPKPDECQKDFTSDLWS